MKSIQLRLLPFKTYMMSLVEDLQKVVIKGDNMSNKLGNTIIKEILDWIYAIVLALIIAMVIHIFLIQPTRVSGNLWMIHCTMANI